jgi:hypothetical protein
VSTGYVWEAIVDFKSGALKSNVKHMAMGRLNVEAAIVRCQLLQLAVQSVQTC